MLHLHAREMHFSVEMKCKFSKKFCIQYDRTLECLFVFNTSVQKKVLQSKYILYYLLLEEKCQTPQFFGKKKNYRHQLSKKKSSKCCKVSQFKWIVIAGS